MRKGEVGAEVRDLQQRLTRAGYDVEHDGWYGEKTEAAVRMFQGSVGLVQDGIAGPKTLAVMAGKPDARHLGQADLEAAADRLAVSVASIMAVNEVESRGEGFLPDGRPVILYERHVMYRRLEAAGKEVEQISAMYPELVSLKRGGYKGGAQEWYRLTLARGIDAAVADESTSWGAFQIMGYHWKDFGYPGIAEFVSSMQTSEVCQLDAFIAFIEADEALHKALRSRKWADFARLYNGPAYKENLYDVKLQRAYDRHNIALAPQGVAA